MADYTVVQTLTNEINGAVYEINMHVDLEEVNSGATAKIILKDGALADAFKDAHEGDVYALSVSPVVQEPAPLPVVPDAPVVAPAAAPAPSEPVQPAVVPAEETAPSVEELAAEKESAEQAQSAKVKSSMPVSA